MLSESLLLPHMLRARGGGGVAGSLAWGVLVDGFRPDRFDIVGALLCLIGVAGSLAWGILVDGFRPDRFDIVGALLCLIGVAVIMYAPRAGT